MSNEKHFISIWFFIGTLLAIYGMLILGAGVYELIAPTAQATAAAGSINNVPRNVMAHLHAEIWWGAFLVILGGVYCYKFFPGRKDP